MPTTSQSFIFRETATTLCCCYRYDQDKKHRFGGNFNVGREVVILYFGGPELKPQTCWMDEVSPVIPFFCECLWPI